MNVKQMNKLIQHCDAYFGQTDYMVYHPIIDIGYHIDVLLYKPNDKYPFWKLVTMGASDYKMPYVKNALSLYNEYIMFVAPEVDLNDKNVFAWYHEKLLKVATFAYYNKAFITYAHSFEWKNDDPDDEMIAAFVEFPQVIETVKMLRCKLGLSKTVACLQVVLLNQGELDMLMRIGPQAFSEYLYPTGDGKQHFLSERHRSDRF